MTTKRDFLKKSAFEGITKKTGRYTFDKVLAQAFEHNYASTLGTIIHRKTDLQKPHLLSC